MRVTVNMTEVKKKTISKAFVMDFISNFSYTTIISVNKKYISRNFWGGALGTNLFDWGGNALGPHGHVPVIKLINFYLSFEVRNIFTKPPSFKNGQMVSVLSACRT